MIELRSDAFKLTYACRRPRSLAARDTGPWEGIMTCIIWLSAITNVLVMGVTSEQLKEVFPSFFDDHGETHDPRKAGIILLVVLEHVLLLAGLAITFGFRKVSRGFVFGLCLLVYLPFFLSFDLFISDSSSVRLYKQTPAWVRDEVRRQEYQRKRALIKQRGRERRESHGGRD